MAKLTYLILHCTATPEGREVSRADIREWHLSAAPRGRGWKQVGYSDLIHLDGKVENLVPYNEDEVVDPWEVTNGVAGINSRCRHVVYAGGCDKKGAARDTRTAAQTESLTDYVFKTLAAHPAIRIGGHNQFNKGKACPSFCVPTWLESIGVPAKNIYTP